MRLRDKIRSPHRLVPLLKRLARSKKKVVFTNGCFDILHSGHVTYLEEAKRLGHVLVVALNTDSSVRKLKGAGRPVNPLQNRLHVLSALEAVDYVTWFGDTTPLKLIRLLKPQVLVKGGDWKASEIVGGKDVRSWGGKVRSLSWVRGQSTTAILKKIRSARRN